MKTWQSGRQHIVRTAVLTAFVASLALATPHRAGADYASNANTAYQNSITEIQVCEAMGGKAEVHQVMTANGAYSVIVTCKGGAMDGFTCINDNYGTTCSFSRMLTPKSRIPEVEAVEIAPLDESTAPQDTSAAVEQTDTVAPVDQGTTDNGGASDVTPTPETSADTGTDPTVSDPVVSDDGNVSAEPTATADAGQIDAVDGSLPVVPVDESITPATDDQIPVKQLDPIDSDGIRVR